MNYLSKAKTHIQTAQRSNTMTKDEIQGLASDIAREVSRQVGYVLEQRLTDTQRAEIQEKRGAVAERYGEVVADNLTGVALDSLYQQVKAPESPATNGNQRFGIPDPEEYFGAAEKVGSRAPEPGGYFFND